MPARIRLQRFGKKGRPFYHIVVADGRAPRDGKCIEKIGTYNPLTQPATIDLCVDKAVKWLENGAQPSDTAKAILSYKGAMYKYHLLKGVKKGAFTAEIAEAKYNKWLEEKTERIAQKTKEKELAKKEAKKKAFAYEKEVNEKREQEQAAKLAKLAAKESKIDAETEATEVIAEVEATTEVTETTEQSVEATIEATEEKTQE